jgi:hypothetical protein
VHLALLTLLFVPKILLVTFLNRHN